MHDDLIDRLRVAAEQNGDTLLLEAADAIGVAREDACVALVADIRFACGDNGKRMQPELVDFIRGLAKDAWRLDWLAGDARQIGVWPYGGRWEIPAIQIDSARDRCTPADLRSAIDDEYQSAITGGEVMNGNKES